MGSNGSIGWEDLQAQRRRGGSTNGKGNGKCQDKRGSRVCTKLTLLLLTRSSSFIHSFVIHSSFVIHHDGPWFESVGFGWLNVKAPDVQILTNLSHHSNHKVKVDHQGGREVDLQQAVFTDVTPVLMQLPLWLLCVCVCVCVWECCERGGSTSHISIQHANQNTTEHMIIHKNKINKHEE